MKTMPTLRALTCALALAAAPLVSAEPHEGDVHPLLPCATAKAGCTIELDDLDDKPQDAATGYAIFEADFGDFPTLFSTDDPGFEHEAGQFIPGTILGLTAVAGLEFWNGSQWLSAPPAGETVTIKDAQENLLVIGAGAPPLGTALIGQVDAAGDLHRHIDYLVTSGASVGAYLITLQLVGLEDDLVTSIYGASLPFMILFNRGLAVDDFEAAVAARTAPIPLPAGVWLLGSGLAALGITRRRT
ncbi:MAG: VPLPA-CTERM sorting domain-containing protein [Gammaproteobacteria bacterium]|nr:VPLPA-CTERM sorting domain-containing protein [Gammaproteobacteria bacterium]